MNSIQASSRVPTIRKLKWHLLWSPINHVKLLWFFCFQPLKGEYLQVFIVFSDNKLNIFWFYTWPNKKIEKDLFSSGKMWHFWLLCEPNREENQSIAALQSLFAQKDSELCDMFTVATAQDKGWRYTATVYPSLYSTQSAYSKFLQIIPFIFQSERELHFKKLIFVISANHWDNSWEKWDRETFWISAISIKKLISLTSLYTHYSGICTTVNKWLF